MINHRIEPNRRQANQRITQNRWQAHHRITQKQACENVKLWAGRGLRRFRGNYGCQLCAFFGCVAGLSRGRTGGWRYSSQDRVRVGLGVDSGITLTSS
jgi:hypothetical protein